MGQTIMVIGIVVAAACYAGWSIYKKAAGKGRGCDCSLNCNSSCPPLDDAEQKRQTNKSLLVKKGDALWHDIYSADDVS